MKKLQFAVAFAVALPLFATPALFSKYEATRQALLKSSLAEVQKSAKLLSAEATKAKNASVAEQADAVAKSPDMAKARAAFAPLSEEMIKLRESANGARPSVYYCPMVRKSWLQPKGEVGNPYDANMPMCGMLKEE